MATFTISGQVTDTTNNRTFRLPPRTITTGDGEHKGSVASGTAQGSITIDAGITTGGGGKGPGFAIFKNMSTDTGYLEWIDVGTGSSDYDQQLEVGGSPNGTDWCMMMLDPAETTIYHKSNSSTPHLLFEIYERGST